MLKKVYILFFSLLILVQTFDRFGQVVYYQLNKDQITEEFCVNKSQPELLCSGKCYLYSQLEEQEREKEKTPVRDSENREIQYVIEKLETSLLDGISNVNHSAIFAYTAPLSQPYYKEILHPPRA